MTTSGEAFANIFCISGILAVLTITIGNVIISKLFNRKATIK